MGPAFSALRLRLRYACHHGAAALCACRGAHDTSPLTNERLPHKMVMPCGTMRRCVDEVAQFVTAMRQQVL